MPTLDDIANGLAALRLEAGNVSFSEIAVRITRRRLEAGMPGYGAKVARSTVYGCFSLGRARVNADLVGEIVLALTDDDDAAAAWRRLSLQAQRNAPATSLSTAVDVDSQVETDNTPAVEMNELLLTHPKVSETDRGVSADRRSGSPDHDPSPETRLSPSFTALALLAGVILNVLPHQLGIALFGDNFPLFFDMIGTAIVAVALGPVMGVATATLTLIPWLFLAGSGYTIAVWSFAPVAVAGALLWGFGVRKFRLGESLSRFAALNLIVAIVCSALAFIAINAVFGGHAVHPIIQQKIDAAVAAGTPEPLAILTANLFASVVDKTLAGLVALIVAGSALRKYAPADLVHLANPKHRNLRLRLNWDRPALIN